MTLAELDNAKAESLREITAASDAGAVEALRVKYVGRNGSIPALIKAMKDVPKEDRPAFGKAVQAWRKEVEEALAAKGAGAAKPGAGRMEDVDVTRPGLWPELGTAHPISRVISESARIFSRRRKAGTLRSRSASRPTAGSRSAARRQTAHPSPRTCG